MNSSTAGMSIPYTFGWRTGGAADAKYTLLAPTSRAISIICSLVVPRTIESSTRARSFLRILVVWRSVSFLPTSYAFLGLA